MLLPNLAFYNRMEAELRDLQSPLLQKDVIQKVFLKLNETVTEAAALRDRKQVDDPELRKEFEADTESYIQGLTTSAYGEE